LVDLLNENVHVPFQVGWEHFQLERGLAGKALNGNRLWGGEILLN
jgi:hypothetical protein